jgi:menaquinone-dependent protoporphyrinogen oxidase
MNNSVLVAYATKYGATAEIAQRVGQALQQAGFDTTVAPADQAGDPASYAAVVLGSAVYAGSWRKEAAAWLETHEAALAGRPTWLFSSGPTGEGDAVELMKGWRFPEALQPVADRIQPRDIAFFHGEIDTSKLNLGEKLLVKGIKAPTGDFRDWDAIESWAGGIAQALHPA